MTETQTEISQAPAAPVNVCIRQMHGRVATTKVCFDHEDPLVADLRPHEVVTLPPSQVARFIDHPCIEVTRKPATRPYRFKEMIEVMEADPRFSSDPQGAIAMREDVVKRLKKTDVDDAQKELRAEMRGQLKGEMIAELRTALRAELAGQIRKELMDEIREELKAEVLAEVKGDSKAKGKAGK